MRKQSTETGLSLFPTELGWMAIAGRGPVLCQLSFGHRSPLAALDSLATVPGITMCDDGWNPQLQERLTAYAAGEFEDFADIVVETGPQTVFQRRVVDHCRSIPYGETWTYGRLAVLAGRSRAARAVGNVMATNRVPLIVPCHRVVAAGGHLGGYSAGEGVRLKVRLLEIESQPVVA